MGGGNMQAAAEVTTSTDTLRQTLIASYEAYDSGLRGFVPDLFDDDVEWTMHCPPEALPFPARLRGKASVLEALKRIDEVVEIVRNDLVFVAVDGDAAAVICDRTLRQRATGRIMRYKVAAFHRYRNGRIIEYQSFLNAIDVLEQTLGREIEIPTAYPT
jgi:ketosteroid isomerase-like protein